jgi:bifunctional non-homologous end joining protein LigD
MLQRTHPAGFIAPCLPIKAVQLPSGRQWLHEIKHDGFRIIARKSGTRVRLYSRPGNDLTDRFPLIVEALARLRSRSCIIDGEAVACGEDGRPSFDRIRYRRHDASVFLFAFDLIELNGDDLRRDPLEGRKATLASVLAKVGPGSRARRWRAGVSACLQAGVRGHRVEAQGVTVSQWSLA